MCRRRRLRGIVPGSGRGTPREERQLDIILYNDAILDFCFYPLRFELVAQDSLLFPPGKAANILRGALGFIFRKLVCVPHCDRATTCDIRESCPYARVFEPVASGDGPSGLVDWPRPFVFRVRHLDGRMVQAGDSFWFDLHVFSLDPNVLSYFVLTFASLAREGLGPRRGKADLRRVLSREQVFYDGCAHPSSHTIVPLSLDLAPSTRSTARIRVYFLTPTELKHDHKVAPRPEFPILFGRIRDRVATLSRLYGAGPLEIDYQGTNERAARVRMTKCQVRRLETERRSTKTAQTHSIGGFVGMAEYQGLLAEFVPFLQVGSWIGVGRQCVWGKGEIRVEEV